MNMVTHTMWASLVAQMVNNLPAMQKTWIQSLGLDDPLEKGMATHSTILTWRIPWTEEHNSINNNLASGGASQQLQPALKEMQPITTFNGFMN